MTRFFLPNYKISPRIRPPWFAVTVVGRYQCQDCVGVSRVGGGVSHAMGGGQGWDDLGGKGGLEIMEGGPLPVYPVFEDEKSKRVGRKIGQAENRTNKNRTNIIATNFVKASELKRAIFNQANFVKEINSIW